MKRIANRLQYSLEYAPEEIVTQPTPHPANQKLLSLLEGRKADLGMDDQQFDQYCQIFHLSDQWITDLRFSPNLVANDAIAPLAQVLGMSVSELLFIRDGERVGDDDEEGEPQSSTSNDPANKPSGRAGVQRNTYRRSAKKK